MIFFDLQLIFGQYFLLYLFLHQLKDNHNENYGIFQDNQDQLLRNNLLDYR